MIKSFFVLFGVILCVSLIVSLTPSAYAMAGSAYTPTQTNAYASYSNATNQVQVSWNFDSITTGDKCVIKMDIEYLSSSTFDFVNPDTG